MKKNNLVLVGFMGVGKGSLARDLQEALNTISLDTDDLIESFTNHSVKKIFEKDGEEYFRGIEQKVVDWVNANVDNSIISTGGGMPIYAQNIEQMGQVFYLKADFDWIYQRLLNSPNADKKIKKRPLFQDPKKAKELLSSREARYESVADVVVDVASLDDDGLVRFILDNYLKHSDG